MSGKCGRVPIILLPLCCRKTDINITEVFSYVLLRECGNFLRIKGRWMTLPTRLDYGQAWLSRCTPYLRVWSTRRLPLFWLCHNHLGCRRNKLHTFLYGKFGTGASEKFYTMKARIILSLLLAVALCLYGCTTENNNYYMDDSSQEEQKTDPTGEEDENENENSDEEDDDNQSGNDDEDNGDENTPDDGNENPDDPSGDGDGNGDETPDDPEEEDDDEDVCQYMKDEAFKQYCYENFDTNDNGRVSLAEATKVTAIECSTATDFTGIEYFPNMESFISSTAKTLDLSQNSELSYISLANNGDITQLDLSKNSKLTTIGDNTFYQCLKLASVSLPETLISIGDYAFYDCEVLPSISFPDGLTTIGHGAFFNCFKLTSISIPDSVTSINYRAFSYCVSLQYVKWPKNLTIQTEMFSGCTSLTQVDNLETVLNIMVGVFKGCESLTSISLGVGAINEKAFYGCVNLTDIKFSEWLGFIGVSAFEGCTSLTSLTLPAAIYSGGYTTADLAFGYCSALKSVTSESETPPTITSTSFEGIDSSATLYVPSGSVDAYKNSEWADNFSTILEY